MSLPVTEREERAAALLEGAVALTPLTPEAGARRYFRPIRRDQQGWLLVRTPDPAPRATSDWLSALGVRVPAIGPERPGAYLVEDAGDRHLAAEPAPQHYVRVLAVAERIGSGDLPAGHPNAGWALDEALFRRELRMFREWYLQAFRKRAHSPVAADAIDALCCELAVEAAGGPWRVQHRDYHSRNLLLGADEDVVVLDHQDLRPGPLFYDLASLWTDAYTDPPAAVFDELDRRRAELGRQHGLSAAESERRFLATALQRVVKALGTFGRQLAQRRDGVYVEPERRARHRALELLDRLPEYWALSDWIR